MDLQDTRGKRDYLVLMENEGETDRWDNQVHKVLLVTAIRESQVWVGLKEKWEMLDTLDYPVLWVPLVRLLLSSSSKEKMESLVLMDYLVCQENVEQMDCQVYQDRLLIPFIENLNH
ncbi:unnamed protein product [Strongylus vulgaris]|uniref:Uncharacterized protein n=1 Tax=Strongylus vulgaris TaxID=40348 RepID=A0A3P7M0L8_STRVU|nr:unnamed protein product [Strongylus vulgaris]